MLPNMMPFSVEATLTLALMLAKSWGAKVRGDGFSTNLRSPKVWIYYLNSYMCTIATENVIQSALLKKRTHAHFVQLGGKETNLKWPAQGCNSGEYHWFGWPPARPKQYHTGWHEHRLQHTLGPRSLSAGSPILNNKLFTTQK